MKLILSLLFVLFTSQLHAEVSPEHVETMLDQMVRENVISFTEATKAKVRLRTMNREEWRAVNKQAKTLAARSPASAVPSANRIQEVNSVDLDGEQFRAIQNEMNKILPKNRN